MKPFILVADGMDKKLFTQLIEDDRFEVHPESKVTQDQLQDILPKVNGLVIRSATTVTKDIVDKAANLKYVIRAGEGTDNIDKKYCQEVDIKVSNTPGANNNSAAEHAVALMMSLLRHIPNANKTMKNSQWEKSKYVGNELTGKKIGIVGFGRIGQIVAKRLAGFEPEVLFYDPFIEASEMSYATKAASLDEIFEGADIITIHTPLMKETKNLVNWDLISKMKKSSVLINASRGGILNEQDLCRALDEGILKGAALDVFANEPLEEDSKLRSYENVVLTPHLGASTEEAQLRVGEMVIHQLQEFFVNNNLLNEVRA